MKLSIFILGLMTLAGIVSAEQTLPLPIAVLARYPFMAFESTVKQQLESSSASDPSRIVGGVNAQDGEIPYQVAIYRDGGMWCGGSFLGPQTVLTAAHCIFGREQQPSTFAVRYGNIDRTKAASIPVSRIVRHASYNSATIDYDVAVLYLGSAFAPSATASTVTLASSAPAAGTLLTVSGWGNLVSGGASPTILQKAPTLEVVTKAACQSAWTVQNTITDRMLCAKSASQSSCNGDSGGPITLNGVQVGIVSWGTKSCSGATQPNVYADVANLRSWIVSNSA